MESNKKFKQLTSGDVVKLEKVGQSLSGVLMSIEESRQFPGSWVVKLKNPAQEKPQVVFVSGIVIDLFKTNGIQIGQEVMIEYQGKRKSESTGRDYNDYKVFA